MGLKDPDRSMSGTDPLLTTRELAKSFGSRSVVQAVSLTVDEGDVYGLLGLNGAGKTTTLRMILGLTRPTRGTIHIGGKEIRFGRPAGREGVGALVEGPALFDRLTALEHLLALGRLTGPVEREEALEVLGKVGLGDDVHRPAAAFSLGMKMRLGLALALMPRPRLVILDEPTNGLDPKGIRDIRELILHLNRRDGISFLISSHLLSEVEHLCNRVGIMQGGTLETEGRLEDMMAAGHRTLRIDASPADAAGRVLDAEAGPGGWHGDGETFRVTAPVDAARVNRALHLAGVSVEALHHERPTLEELFLDRTGGP
jgi:ABC-type multidrug transport system ATPase subunit